jgi:non-specific serine/threonine protein kinase
VLDLLTSLVEKSLVQYEAHDGEARYRLLETMRQYSWERLRESGESEGVGRRHVEFFLRLAEEAAPKLEGSEQGEWLERLEREHDNLRAALDFCQAADDGGEAGLRLAASLAGSVAAFWIARGYWSEGRERLARALARPQAMGPTAARARALMAAGWFAGGAGWFAGGEDDWEVGRACYEESLAIYRELGDRPGIALALTDLGAVAVLQGDAGGARRLLEEALAIFRSLGIRRPQAPILYWLGRVAMAEGDDVRAKPFFEEALAIDREFGHRGGAASGALGQIALREGDYTAAHRIFEEDLRSKRELKHKPAVAELLASLGDVAYALGDYETAQAHYEEGLTILREIGDKPAIAVSLQAMAAVAAARGQGERTARLLGAANAQLKAVGARVEPALWDPHERNVSAVRAALGKEAFAAAWAEGRAISLDQAIDEALTRGRA